jgi:serine/threonine protein kinase
MKIDKRTLGTAMAEGGEGLIYFKQDVLKVFKPVVDFNSKLHKLEILLQTKLPKVAVAPKDLLYDYGGNFIGYSMQNLKEIEEFRALTNKKTLLAYNIKIGDILHMLVDVRDAILELHQQNIFVGDLNDSNIVFDGGMHVHLLDVDSWSVGSYPCTVAMDSFKDPKLKGADFNAGTDSFSFAILAFKSLTRFHPFGGTTKPDLDLLERMSRGLSVLNPKVKAVIPRIIDPWDYMFPGFLEDLARIYDAGIRLVVTKSLDEFAGNLTRCKQHQNDYYGRYDKCPVCFQASLKPAVPTKLQTVGGISVVVLFTSNDCLEMLSKDSYLSVNREIVHIPSGIRKPVKFGQKTYFLKDGSVVEATVDTIITPTGVIPKLHGSRIIIDGDDVVHFITPACGFCSMKNAGFVTDSHVAINNVFEVSNNGNYCIVNLYDYKTIVEIDKWFLELDEVIKLTSYGLHFDAVSGRWLFIYETVSGKFVTYVFELDKVVYRSDTMKYSVPLDTIAFHRNTIYTAHDGVIRGFNWKKNEYKDFKCDQVEEDATLQFKGSKIIVINQREVYEAG